jgi:ankyrin repeat protein
MAETVGPAASVVALADLFNNTVACFQFIQLDRAFGESFQRNQFELDIARLRLLRWGKSLKLDGNVPDAKSLQRHYRSGATAKHTEPLLSQTLDLAGADGASNVHNNWIEFHDNSLVVNDAQTEPDSAMSKLHETLQQLSIERQDHSGERQKAKRVLYLKTDFRRLIKSITELLNSLDKLSALSQRERRDIEIAAIGESEGVSVLREIAVDADKQLEYAFAGTSNETDVEALHRAAFDGYLFTVQLLLDKGTNIDAQSISYGSALYSASYRGREHVVKLLLNHGADVNSSAGGSYGNALYSSSFRGHEHVVKLLLDHGADVNSSVGGSYGNALQGASFHGHEHVVKLLLNHGADVNASAGGYGSALYSASLQGHEHVVKLLLSSGADVNAPGGKCGSALGAACLYGYHQVVQLLLNHGSNVEMRGGSYGTPLYIASESGKQEVVECLLAAGANPNAHDNRSIGALYRASLTGHVEIVKLMLSAGADGNASGGFYGTALQAASYQGNKVVVEILLEAGAAVNSSGGHYGQALQAACSSGDEGIVKQLLNAGADMDAEGGHFGTALQAASSGGFRNLVLILLEAGASTQSRGGKHGSALQAALCGGHQKIADILRTASTTSELQAGLPGQTNPRQRSYRNVSQMLQEVEHSDLGRSGVTLRFECEILAVVSAPELSKDRGLEGWTKELLQNNVAVVCSRSKSDGNDKIRTIRALTCIEYTESRWGSLGTRLLKDIANLCTMQPRCQLQSGQSSSERRIE